MKTIGLIGGMGWEASAQYYRRINELTHAHLGNMASARIHMISLNNRIPAEQMYKGRWAELLRDLNDCVKDLEKTGIDCLALACNSVHHIADELRTNVPLIHIADAVGLEAVKNKHKRLLLLGTKFTCNLDFYQNRLKAHDIKLVIPDQNTVNRVHAMIYNKLKVGYFPEDAPAHFIQICTDLAEACDGIILGCTELPLLVEEYERSRNKKDNIFFYNTIELHCRSLVNFSLN